METQYILVCFSEFAVLWQLRKVSFLQRLLCLEMITIAPGLTLGSTQARPHRRGVVQTLVETRARAFLPRTGRLFFYNGTTYGGHAAAFCIEVSFLLLVHAFVLT